MSDLFHAQNLASAYGQSQVLWDIDLSIGGGGALGLIGRNGVGKTTLLKAIMGVQPVQAGALMFGGEDITQTPAHLRARKGIALVPQGRHIFPQLTVMENLRTGLSATGDRAPSTSLPDYIFDLFPKLRDIRARKGGFLSGGEQQQLAIGRALAGAPRLLLLDEPTEGIQPNVVEQIKTALTQVRTELGIAVLIVEQYLDFVWSFADDYAAMQGGRIVQAGKTKDDSAADVAHLVQV